MHFLKCSPFTGIWNNDLAAGTPRYHLACQSMQYVDLKMKC